MDAGRSEAEGAAGLPPTPGYRYAEAVGDRLFLAGQVPHDAAGMLVGDGDPAAQARQCLENLHAVVAGHGFVAGDVRRLTVSVVGPDDHLGSAWRAVRERFGGQAPPATLIGVARLGHPGQLVEIDADVVRDPFSGLRFRLTGGRVMLDPLRVEDADEMAAVLADPGLYAFTGGEPPDAGTLRDRYRHQVVGASPDGTETWLNWIVLLGDPARAIGYVQATVDRATSTADVAWVIGTPWQAKGYATEATSLMIAVLRGAGARRIVAHIHPEHLASRRVAQRVGLAATSRTVDGETEWELL